MSETTTPEAPETETFKVLINPRDIAAIKRMMAIRVATMPDDDDERMVASMSMLSAMLMTAAYLLAISGDEEPDLWKGMCDAAWENRALIDAIDTDDV